MKILATTIACSLVLTLAGLSFAADTKEDVKTNKDKIVGVWEVTKSETAPVGTTVEFTKDGKLIVTVKDGDKTEKIEGTYTVDKDSISSVLKEGDKEHKETVKIKKLTDKELVIVEVQDKTIELKKK